MNIFNILSDFWHDEDGFLNLLTQFGGGIAGLFGLGAAAGAQPDKSMSWIDAGLPGQTEQDYDFWNYNNYKQMEDLVGRGPGAGDVANATSGYRNLAQMFQDAAKTGGVPTQQDIDVSNGFARDMFASRRVGLEQSFQQQNTDTERLAARLGRPVNDPILQAKMRTGFMQQSDMLNADQTGFASQYAMGLPDRRLAYASQGADIQGNLAYQAMQNRAAILGLGSQLHAAKFNERLQTAKRYGESGGGFKGAVEGGIAGLGAAASIGGMFMGMPGIGGGGAGASRGFSPSASGGYVGAQPGPWSGGYVTQPQYYGPGAGGYGR